MLCARDRLNPALLAPAGISSHYAKRGTTPTTPSETFPPTPLPSAKGALREGRKHIDPGFIFWAYRQRMGWR